MSCAPATFLPSLPTASPSLYSLTPPAKKCSMPNLTNLNINSKMEVEKNELQEIDEFVDNLLRTMSR